jgi:pilus assembly protein Flp/PilA
MSLLREFLNDEAGATAIEYSMIAGAISILIVGGITSIGDSISIKFLGPLSGALN